MSEDPLQYDVRQADYVAVDQVIWSYAENIRTELRMSRYYEAPTMGVVKAFLNGAPSTSRACR